MLGALLRGAEKAQTQLTDGISNALAAAHRANESFSDAEMHPWDIETRKPLLEELKEKLGELTPLDRKLHSADKRRTGLDGGFALAIHQLENATQLVLTSLNFSFQVSADPTSQEEKVIVSSVNSNLALWRQCCAEFIEIVESSLSNITK